MKRISVLILVILFSFSAVSAVYLRDEAALLGEEERAGIERILSDVSARTGISTVIVTDNNTGDNDIMSLADAIIEEPEYGDDGALFFIDAGHGQFYISTTGYALYALDDNALSEYSLRPVISDLSSGFYYRAFTKWANHVEKQASLSPRSDYESSVLTDSGDWRRSGEKKAFSWGPCIFFSFAISGFISLFFISREKKKLNSAVAVNNADDYCEKDGFRLTVRNDIFLYSNVVRTRRARSTGPQSHHTSTHVSSSGRMHGGRGGRF